MYSPYLYLYEFLAHLVHAIRQFSHITNVGIGLHHRLYLGATLITHGIFGFDRKRCAIRRSNGCLVDSLVKVTLVTKETWHVIIDHSDTLLC